MHTQILFTRILEGPTNYQDVEDELNRLLTGVKGEVISVQIEEIQPLKEYLVYVTTKKKLGNSPSLFIIGIYLLSLRTLDPPLGCFELLVVPLEVDFLVEVLPLSSSAKYGDHPSISAIPALVSPSIIFSIPR